MNKSRQGVTTILMVSMMMIVSAATLSLMVVFSAEARRTRDAGIAAQQRQLLLAGTKAALEALRAEKGESLIHVVLPESLRATLTVEMESISPAPSTIAMQAVITATVDDHPARSTVIFEGQGNQWKLRSAVLK